MKKLFFITFLLFSISLFSQEKVKFKRISKHQIIVVLTTINEFQNIDSLNRIIKTRQEIESIIDTINIDTTLSLAQIAKAYRNPGVLMKDTTIVNKEKSKQEVPFLPAYIQTILKQNYSYNPVSHTIEYTQIITKKEDKKVNFPSVFLFALSILSLVLYIFSSKKTKRTEYILYFVSILLLGVFATTWVTISLLFPVIIILYLIKFIKYKKMFKQRILKQDFSFTVEYNNDLQDLANTKYYYRVTGEGDSWPQPIYFPAFLKDKKVNNTLVPIKKNAKLIKIDPKWTERKRRDILEFAGYRPANIYEFIAFNHKFMDIPGITQIFPIKVYTYDYNNENKEKVVAVVNYYRQSEEDIKRWLTFLYQNRAENFTPQYHDFLLVVKG